MGTWRYPLERDNTNTITEKPKVDAVCNEHCLITLHDVTTIIFVMISILYSVLLLRSFSHPISLSLSPSYHCLSHLIIHTLPVPLPPPTSHLLPLSLSPVSSICIISLKWVSPCPHSATINYSWTSIKILFPNILAKVRNDFLYLLSLLLFID